MARINLCFLWHMHQPFYRDLVSGEYRLPWVRLHALKDYYGMVKILEEFPAIRQTFNLVPSLVRQLEDYATGEAKDRHLEIALKEAESLTAAEKQFLLNVSFRANEGRMIRRYPRYAELWEMVQHNAQMAERSVGAFTAGMLRDLQVLSQLAWFDEEFLTHDPTVSALAKKGRDFTTSDQRMLAQKQRELLRKVLTAYRDAAARQQIEISTSPFYHPILPLLCDSNIAEMANPYAALPAQFRYPDDASWQMREAKQCLAQTLDTNVEGLWPPEGALSNEVLTRAAQAGFRWTATDDTLLSQTLGREPKPSELYRPYLWQQGHERILVLFRDHRLCDLLTVAYARMEAQEAASHFLGEIHRACDPLLHLGHNATLAIILDGENAWEQYPENGRPFLHALYRRISEDRQVVAVTVKEALENASPARLDTLFPGSWIDGNFKIWIGAEEDNQAWELLLAARRKFDEAAAGAEPKKSALAWRELMIAEGSDWCWWYGPEHSADSRGEFDTLFREHLSNVYRLLGHAVPPELSHPLLKSQEPQHRAPVGMIQPVVDGRQTSHAEWANAGRYRADHTSGPMHIQGPPLRELRYGSDGQNLYLWLGQGDSKKSIDHMDLRLIFRNSHDEEFSVGLQQKDGHLIISSALASSAVHAAVQDAFEIKVSLAALHSKPGSQIFMRVEVHDEGLPVGSLPAYGALKLKECAVAAYSF